MTTPATQPRRTAKTPGAPAVFLQENVRENCSFPPGGAP